MFAEVAFCNRKKQKQDVSSIQSDSNVMLHGCGVHRQLSEGEHYHHAAGASSSPTSHTTPTCFPKKQITHRWHSAQFTISEAFGEQRCFGRIYYFDNTVLSLTVHTIHKHPEMRPLGITKWIRVSKIMSHTK